MIVMGLGSNGGWCGLGVVGCGLVGGEKQEGSSGVAGMWILSWGVFFVWG
jgi:hypothetical protein